MVNLLKLLLELASVVAKYLHDKQLLEAGAAQEILKNINETNNKIATAKRAMDNINSVPISQDKYNIDK